MKLGIAPIAISTALAMYPYYANSQAIYVTSYAKDATVGSAATKQLDALRQQIPTVNTVFLTVHLRVPGGAKSNNPEVGEISEDPGHLAGWFASAKAKGLKPSLAIILFSDNSFAWGGDWNPSDVSTALSNYYTAVRPWVQAADQAGAKFLILTDEWTGLHNRKDAAPALQSLIKSARADFHGKIGMNLSQPDEGLIDPAVAHDLDFIGITAYHNAGGNYDQARKILDPYMASLAELSRGWCKPIILTAGFKSTPGAGSNPSEAVETTAAPDLQAELWRGFLDAARTQKLAVSVWRWWPGSQNDDGQTGFTPQGKPAAKVIANGLPH